MAVKMMRGGVVGIVLAFYSMTGCAAVPIETAGQAPEIALPMGGSDADNAAMAIPQQTARVQASSEAAVSPLPVDPTVPAGRPQLIKRASLTLDVDAIDPKLDDITQLIAAEQGDILNLRDGDSGGSLNRTFIRIRVPQHRLEALIERLLAIGTVVDRTISAEDVSTQLVDLQARIRNLRQSEAALLGIMERSGSIGDVLEVSRELSGVRQQIEQLDAQAKHLQTQVSYATLELTVQSPGTAASTQPTPLGQTLGSTWQSARQSVGELTTGLLQLGLWLLAYSPYLVTVAIAVTLGYRSRRRPRPSDSSTNA